MNEFLRRLIYLCRWRRHDADLDEEIAFHRDMKERELSAGGVSPGVRQMAITRALGNDVAARQYARDVWLWPWLRDAAADVRFALRLLRRNPAFSVTAILVLGLGIGVNHMMFTVIYGHTLRPLPMARPDRVVHISATDDRGADRSLSVAQFDDLSAAGQFSAVAAFATAPLSIGDRGRVPERVDGAYITANAFALIERAPILGRGFLPSDDRTAAPRIALLSDVLWRSRYSSDRSVIGGTVQIDGLPTTVVGVMPDRSGFPAVATVWLPLSQMPGVGDHRDAPSLRAIGRLRDGSTIAAAREEVDGLVVRRHRESAPADSNVRARVVLLRDRLMGRPTDPAWIAFISIGVLVLAASCANVANLLLARAATRSREIAIRGSLGAGRSRIVTQLLVESAVLASAAAIVGGLLSATGARLFKAAIPENVLPYWLNYDIDARVFAALVLASFGAVLIFALVPALQASRIDIGAIVKDGGRTATSRGGSRRWTTAFLAAQVALTVLLAANGAVGVMRTRANLASDAVINSPQLLTASVTLPARRYPTTAARAAVCESLRERIQRIPGVERVTFASSIPAFPSAPNVQIELAHWDGAERPPAVTVVTIDDEYFATLGVPLQRGRTFAATDTQPVAIVGQRFVEMFFGNDEPMGQRIRMQPAGVSAGDRPWATIVGVAQDIRHGGTFTAEPVVYVPRAASTPSTLAIIVRAAGDAAAIAPTVREAAAAIDPDVPLYRMTTMSRAIHDSQWNGRISQQMILVLTAIAFCLAVAGLYAVAAHGVAQRAQEIGIRMALGATRRTAGLLVLRRALGQVGLGLLAGIAATVAWDAIFPNSRDDLGLASLSVLASTCGFLLLITVAACAAPMRRAAGLDPVAALRHE